MGANREGKRARGSSGARGAKKETARKDDCRQKKKKTIKDFEQTGIKRPDQPTGARNSTERKESSLKGDLGLEIQTLLFKGNHGKGETC